MKTKSKLLMMASCLAATANWSDMYNEKIYKTNETKSTLTDDEKASRKVMSKTTYRGETIYYTSKKSLLKKMKNIDKKLLQQ